MLNLTGCTLAMPFLDKTPEKILSAEIDWPTGTSVCGEIVKLWVQRRIILSWTSHLEQSLLVHLCVRTKML